MIVGTINDEINKIEPSPADFETAISNTGKIYYIILNNDSHYIIRYS